MSDEHLQMDDSRVTTPRVTVEQAYQALLEATIACAQKGSAAQDPGAAAGYANAAAMFARAASKLGKKK